MSRFRVRRRLRAYACVLAGSVALLGAPASGVRASEEADFIALHADEPLNAFQFLGTHNSYHQWPRLFGIPLLPIPWSKEHRYSHPTLTEQLKGKEGAYAPVRQLELDVHQRRRGNLILVHHLPWVDNQSSCKTLRRCLQEIEAWSKSVDHEHAPILVWIEPKDDNILDEFFTFGFYEEVDLRRVEKTILRVIDRERIITPDDVRKGERGLPEALRKYGWPTLGESKGKYLFALLDREAKRTCYSQECRGGNLEGRLMFVRSTDPEDLVSAVYKINNAQSTYEDMLAFGTRAITDPELIQIVEIEGLALPPETAADEDDDVGDAEAPPVRALPGAVEAAITRVPFEDDAESAARQRAALVELEQRRIWERDDPRAEDLELALAYARRSKTYRLTLLELLEDDLRDREQMEIVQQVRNCFLVTTTADNVSRSARRNRRRSTSAERSAAQYISTDSLVRQRRSRYTIDIKGPAIRPNGVQIGMQCGPASREATTAQAAAREGDEE